MIIDWSHELPIYWRFARGDVAIYCTLVGLRVAEGGSAGRELGVLSATAPTLQAQADIAANSLHHAETRYIQATGLPPRDATTGLYTDAFLEAFSHRWAPLGAPNDPRHLNEHHADNLRNGTRSAEQSVTNRVLGITV